MSLKKMGLLAIAGILIVAGALVVFRDHVIGTKNAQAEITDLGSLYEATEEIAAAKEQFQKGMEPAEIVTRMRSLTSPSSSTDCPTARRRCVCSMS